MERKANCGDCGRQFQVGDYENNNEEFCARCLAQHDMRNDRCNSGECGGCPNCEGDY